MRSITASTLAIAFCMAGCVGPAPSTSPELTNDVVTPAPAETSMPSSSTPAATSLPVPMPTAVPTATFEPPQPDRYPPSLVGRMFLLPLSTDSTQTVVGRIGEPGRVILPLGETVIDVSGDRLTTQADAPDGIQIRAWSFATGQPVSKPSVVPGANAGYAFVAGSVVVVVSEGDEEADVVGGITIVRDGLVRELVPESTPSGYFHPTRDVVPSRTGMELATTICSSTIDFVGDCGMATLLDPATGDVTGSIDLHGGRLVEFDAARMLLFWLDHFEVWDRSDHLVWSSASYTDKRFLGGVRFLDDGRVLATVFVSGSPSVRRVLLFDAKTGQIRVLATIPLDPAVSDEIPDVELELSTDSFLAVGLDPWNCGLLNFRCGQEAPYVIDAAVLDIATAKLTPGGIHITFAE